MTGVWKKLNLKDQEEIVVLSAPDSFAASMDELEATTVKTELRSARAIDFLLAFVTKKKDIERVAKSVKSKGQGDLLVWFAYPKKSSKNYTCEFDRDTGWDSVGEAGLEGVRQVAIDDDWSAIRFRRVEYIKKMIRDPKRAITKKGKKKTSR